MRRFQLSKLVRDKIPQLNEEAGLQNQGLRVLTHQEYLTGLLNKMVEESVELSKQADRKEIIKELADLFEIIDAVQKELNIADDEIRSVQSVKRSKKGGFDKKMYIESLQMSDDNQWAEYYASEPDVFPELPIIAT